MDHQYSTVRESLYTIAAGLLVVVFCLLLLYQDANFFWVDDAQSQHIPALWDIARSWQEGELPLLSPYSWFGGALAAEYQYGIFSLSTSLIFFLIWKLQLSLPTTAALFSIIHLSITAAGGFRLARQRALSIDLSMMVGLVAALNGWLLLWAAVAWIPALTSFAWLPWAWWGLQWSLQAGSSAIRCILAGFFIYLILAAGAPFTVLMIGLITVWLALRQWRVNHSIKRLSRLAVAWLLGLGLAAPALLMLIEYSNYAVRQKMGFVTQWLWVVPIYSLPGLILPSFTVTWLTFLGWRPHASVELACGLAPAIIFPTTLILLRRELLQRVRWELGLFAVTFLLSIGPSIFPLRWSFRWLSLLHLLLAILAAEGLELLRTKQINSKSTNNIQPLIKVFQNNCGVWAFSGVMIVWLVSLILRLDITEQSYLLGIKLLLISLCWAIVEQVFSIQSHIRRLTPVAVILISFWVTYQQIPTNLALPHWKCSPNISKVAPFDPNIRYLSLYSGDDMFKTDKPVGTIVRFGNSSMCAGVEFINGYSPIMPIGLRYLLQLGGQGYMNRSNALLTLQREIGSTGLLALMGVDGLVVPDSIPSAKAKLLEEGWQLIASSEEGSIFHRPGPPSPRIRSVLSVQTSNDYMNALTWLVSRTEVSAPFVLLKPESMPSQQLSFAATNVKLVAETRLRAIAQVEPLNSSGESLVLFSRPWYPGYRATLNGKEVPVEVINYFLPAVRLPAGAQGELILEYRPSSFVIGVIIALITLLLTALAIILILQQRRSAVITVN
ncbi:MAG: hypothetical protein AB1489_00120 [Acidobacteriota bacterium]